MTVSIIIAHYGAPELLTACLAALWANTSLPVEVVVVDNGTGQPIDADVVIRNDMNLGFAEACNQGAAAAQEEMLVFLNNDTEVRSGWLEPLVAHLDQGAGIVGSLLLYPDGTVQHAGVRFYRNGKGVLIAENRRAQHAGGLVEAVTGACMAICRATYFELGAMDTGYLNGYEDVALCLTARAAGRTVIFEPASVVTHHESAAGAARWVALRENIVRLQEQWADYQPVEVPT